MITQQRGFTLIEILIAMTILFAAVATSMLAFQNSMHSTERAARAVTLLTPVDDIIAHIRGELQEQVLHNAADELSGDGRVLAVDYQWRATVDARRYPSEATATLESERVNAQREFILYRIELTLTQDRAQRDFEYLELVWRNRARS
ncbi:MAG: prepilin-type N-terminal cleavage/methylation domain-containing protein [Aliidiomarina sp.]|uniref:type II secretion system protein n=1 Tax=Aliidiomarina sp. TaxID=1872439 RepID=UPI0025C4D8C9|nr:type II secretion system protein [Aliidiomarina sp.]MCH8502471.1 prepilin-type N-terminal cleavage/methylation domain-containing protein [Aliidiomarina sp.]